MASTFAPKTESAVYSYLRASGWEVVGMNKRTNRIEWRHRALTWHWPTHTAAHLQREADAGGKEMIHRMLRGEA